MNLNFNVQEGINRFGRLGTWYVLALSAIATVAIIGQVLIQNHLTNQRNDAHVVNVAGKQRMLSQKISKSLLKLSPAQSTSDRKIVLNNLRQSLELWKVSQDGLLHGNDSLNLGGNNSPEVSALFEEVTPHFNIMAEHSAKVVVSISHNIDLPYDSIRASVETVLQHEGNFLTGMEKIVYQYDDEAGAKVARLSYMEYLLLGVSIVVILLEIFFIFRPTTIHVNKTISKLIDSEKNAKKLSKEIGALYASLEKSYEQISHINEPVENPKLYAKADKGGTVTFIAQLFGNMTGKSEVTSSLRISDLFEGSSSADDWMDEVIDTVSEGNHWQGQVHFKSVRGEQLWSDIVISPVYDVQGDIDELVIMGSDITRHKKAEQSMSLKNKAEIEKKINQQKFRSVLILEGQEEERKRLAMDIHDGIGQLLTSLKFQIESIDLKNDLEASRKFKEIQTLIVDVIKEVRRVTFDLKPTVLGDYGLNAGLNVFIREIGKLTNIELNYIVDGEITHRLPQKTENNIFRIVQEAINNAIKYSDTRSIEVKLSQTEKDIVISVKDDGNGFDEKLVEARSMNIDSGRGFFNMYERTEYINGHLDIRSAPGQGTTVTLTVPVRSSMAVEEV
jgi:two-component system, NarL family, sensor histidine kinase DegS